MHAALVLLVDTHAALVLPLDTPANLVARRAVTANTTNTTNTTSVNPKVADALLVDTLPRHIVINF
jgi:hypothetical protein